MVGRFWPGGAFGGPAGASQEQMYMRNRPDIALPQPTF